MVTEVESSAEQITPSRDLPEPSGSRYVKAKVQEELKQQLIIVNADLVGLYERKNSGILTQEQEVELKEKEKKKTELEACLKKYFKNIRQQKSRAEKKRRLNELFVSNPELKKALKVRERHGRPRIEDDQPFLLKAIVDIAILGSAAHERWQSDLSEA